MSKHTPGPWVIGRIDRKKQHVEIDAPHGDPSLGYKKWQGFVRVYGSDEKPREGTAAMLANAKLIAAAPDLLAALEEVVAAADGRGWEQLSPLLENQRRAIIKAGGKA